MHHNYLKNIKLESFKINMNLEILIKMINSNLNTVKEKMMSSIKQMRVQLLNFLAKTSIYKNQNKQDL